MLVYYLGNEIVSIEQQIFSGVKTPLIPNELKIKILNQHIMCEKTFELLPIKYGSEKRDIIRKRKSNSSSIPVEELINSKLNIKEKSESEKKLESEKIKKAENEVEFKSVDIEPEDEVIFKTEEKSESEKKHIFEFKTIKFKKIIFVPPLDISEFINKNIFFKLEAENAFVSTSNSKSHIDETINEIINEYKDHCNKVCEECPVFNEKCATANGLFSCSENVLDVLDDNLDYKYTPKNYKSKIKEVCKNCVILNECLKNNFTCSIKQSDFVQEVQKQKQKEELKQIEIELKEKWEKDKKDFQKVMSEVNNYINSNLSKYRIVQTSPSNFNIEKRKRFMFFHYWKLILSCNTFELAEEYVLTFNFIPKVIRTY